MPSRREKSGKFWEVLGNGFVPHISVCAPSNAHSAAVGLIGSVSISRVSSRIGPPYILRPKREKHGQKRIARVNDNRERQCEETSQTNVAAEVAQIKVRVTFSSGEEKGTSLISTVLRLFWPSRVSQGVAQAQAFGGFL
jgi:hypothetical protein